jgi:3-keto-disaccharide hydrolase
MRGRETFVVVLSAVIPVVLGGAALVLLRAAAAEEDGWNKGLPRQYKSKWLVSDSRRPMPAEVAPGAGPGAPPSDAIVLFDGKDLSKWVKAGSDQPAGWKVEDGYVEMTPTGSIATKEKFGDCQLHIEWRAPSPPQKDGQGRGNSGVYFMGRYEVQVLDSYKNKTYADGTAASIYAQHPPLVNASRPPGEWQSYDIVFRAPRFKDGKVAEPARITAFHNGVLVHHDAEVYGPQAYRALAEYKPHEDSLMLQLQDHGDKQPVRFRNIWIRKLDLTPEPVE